MKNDAGPGRGRAELRFRAVPERGRGWLLGVWAGVSVLGVLAGCAAPVMFAGPAMQAVSVGAGAFSNGELTAAWPVPMEELWISTRRVIDELQFPVKAVRTSEDAQTAIVFADDTQGRDVEIRVDAVTPVVSTIRIRVGFWGDEAVSRLVLSRIEQDLRARLGPGADGTPQ